MKDFSKLEKTIKIKFKNKDLLRQSMVHRSYINENPKFDVYHNERLEFLGDAVLEIIVTEYLFHNFPKVPEGTLTNWRASLVNSKMLFEIAKEIELERCLYLSKGELKDKNSKARNYILADAVEALIGAAYLDQGREPIKDFIHVFIISKLDNIIKNNLYIDPKSRFQEKAQEKHGITPHYQIMDEKGPDHKKKFTVGLYLNEKFISSGTGYSKQEAQIKAAEKGLKSCGW